MFGDAAPPLSNRRMIYPILATTDGFPYLRVIKSDFLTAASINFYNALGECLASYFTGIRRRQLHEYFPIANCRNSPQNIANVSRSGPDINNKNLSQEAAGRLSFK